MKKQIIISTFIGALIWSVTAAAILNTASAKESNSPQELIANNSIVTTTTPLATKNETVYVMTDENGNIKSKFIGNTLYSGNEELPFNFKVSYFLNGQEIAANELAGKSGHVKIVFNYASIARYQNRLVPFLAITNLTLDHSKFTNIKLDNGKIIHETPDTYIIAGFSLAGVGNNLGVNFIPETFSLEADVTDFKLENTYTVFDNNLIADLDLSKLTDLDSVVNSIYQLSDGLDKIIAGSNTLVDGAATALDGTKKLYEGSKSIANGTTKIKDSLTALSTKNDELTNGASNIFDSILATTSQSLAAQIGQEIELTQENFKTTMNYLITMAQEPTKKAVLKATLEKLEGVESFCTGLKTYTGYITEAIPYAAQLSEGATELSKGLGSLVEGETKLYQGSITLRDGLTTFKTSGIDKLVKFATQDLSRFTNNLRATIRAAGSYKNFGNTDAKSVKFIVKTPSI